MPQKPKNKQPCKYLRAIPHKFVKGETIKVCQVVTRYFTDVMLQDHTRPDQKCDGFNSCREVA